MKALIALLSLVAVTAHAQSVTSLLPTPTFQDTAMCDDGQGHLNRECMLHREQEQVNAQIGAQTPEQRAAMQKMVDQIFKENK